MIIIAQINHSIKECYTYVQYICIRNAQKRIKGVYIWEIIKNVYSDEKMFLLNKQKLRRFFTYFYSTQARCRSENGINYFYLEYFRCL